jgi:signal transduction histidine kinase/CheY-like chemotaxis protein/HPt (histidine-containing phosphotransfer) domain-containing protein
MSELESKNDRDSDLPVTASVVVWTALSVALAVLAWLPGAAKLTLRSSVVWLGAHLGLAITAYVVLKLRGNEQQKKWQRLRPAHLLALFSAVLWGLSGIILADADNPNTNLAVLVTVTGLALAAVWLFLDEALLCAGVLISLLAPTLVRLLIGQEPNFSMFLTLPLLVLAHALISRRAKSPTSEALPASLNTDRDLARRTAEIKFQAEEENRELRTEIEKLRSFEAELKSAKQTADAANMAKGEFLATMSHEIRTPLNGIIPLLEIVRDTKLEADQREYINTAYGSARALLRIIDDILDYSKIEAGKLELEQTGLNIRDVIDSVTRLMEKAAEKKGLRISTQIDPQMRLAMRGDPVRLRQVLTNLVSNAIKFTERGSIQIQVSKRSENRTHNDILFAVRDTGVGVSNDVAERLFKPFSQADASTTRIHGGTGLGLVICKRIVDLMGGKIGVKSELGKGSIFWFSTPLLKSAGDVAGPKRELSGSRAIVLVNDARLSQRLTNYLGQMNVQTTLCTTTADALGKLKSSSTLGESWQFNLLLIDLASMRATAPALVRNLVREPALERIKLIYIQGDEPPSTEVMIAGRSAGVSRQFTDADLHAALARAIEGESNEPTRFNLLEEASKLGQDARLAVSAGGTPSTPLKGHVLLVEDNPVNRQVAQRLISLAGLSADIAENGKEAVEKMAHTQYDAVLMDCQMPVMDGYTATRTRRMLEKERKLPRATIIAMTANAMAGDREKCLDSGMDDYMSKPLNRALMADVLRKWLSKGSQTTIDSAAVRATPKPAAVAYVSSAPAVPTLLTEPVKLTSTGPAINRGIFDELLDVMGPEFVQLVKVYLEDTPKNLKVLYESAERGDVEGMIAPAHSLKSTSANLGAMGLSEACRTIEQSARKGGLNQPLSHAREAQRLFKQTADELSAIMAQIELK